MNKVVPHIIFSVLVLFHYLGNTQIQGVNSRFETIIESILEEIDEETDAFLIIEDLQILAETPLNINKATREQLGMLHLLNNIRIEKLLEYVNTYGPLYSIYELNAVDGFNPDLIFKMEPFIWFGPLDEATPSFSQMLKYGRNEILFRGSGVAQKAKGYHPKVDGSIPYEGNRIRYYTRYRFSSADNISAGITAEKDPGESFFSGSNPQGFDFYSAHVSLKVNKVLQNITLGDFVVRSGQGLILWQGFSMGKSLDSQNIIKTSQGVRPYTSTDENMFFRGASGTLILGNIKFNAFFSRKNIDGNIAYSDSTGYYFTSLQLTGYHRTAGESEDKNSVGDFNSGAIMNWQSGNLKLGSTILYRQFSIPLIPSEQLYNFFNFKGKENITAGVDYLFSKGKYQFFGESALSKSGGIAFLQGVTAYLHDQFQLSAYFRHFDRDYHALWASPFSEGNAAANEKGLYFGAQILPIRNVTLSAYSDVFHSEWIKYTTAAPANGYDVFLQADFRLSRNIQFYLRHKMEEKDRKFRLDEKNVNLPEKFRKSRIHVQYQPLGSLTLKTRVEYVSYHGLNAENGILLFQDVQYTPMRFPLNFSVRAAWFHTDSYNSRIYAYENDLLYTFSIPAFFGNGFRTYLNLKYKINEKTEFWLKFAESLHFGTEKLGTGLNEIQGNQKTEVKFQLRMKI